MENFVHASVSHAALAEFGRNARAVGVQLHALEIFEKNECMSGISPFALIRRTAIPMIGGLIVMVVTTIILN